MRRPLLLFLLLMLCLGGKAQHSLYNLKFTLSRKNFVDTIAIGHDHGRVTLPVTFQGRTYRFLLDTGASQTTLFDDTPIDGTLPVGTTVSHDATGRRTTVDKVLLPPMTIGSVTFTGCEATVQHRVVRRTQDIDGIIGFDIVCKGLCMKIDVRRQQLVLTDRKHYFDHEPGVRTKYRLDLHVPYVTVSPFGTYREQVLFDTGSRLLYAMNKASFDRGEQAMRGQLGEQVEGRSWGRYAMGHGGVEPRGEVVFLSLDRLLLGGFAFSQLHTLTTQGGSHLGCGILDFGAVVFNPKRRTLCFQPYNGGELAIVDNPQVEKAIIPIDGRPVVGLVREGSDAYLAGFREGDVIVSADGRAIDSFADYMAFRPLASQVYRFIVRDSKGFLKEVNTRW